MIRLWCDHCGEELSEETTGAVRCRISRREFKMHVCSKHQEKLIQLLTDFSRGALIEVNPSLKGAL